MMTDQNPLVTVCVGQIWRHKRNHKEYIITELLNAANALDDDNNPPIVVYREYGEITELGRWGRYFTLWHNSFELVK